MKRILWLLLISSAWAQSFVTVTSSNIYGGSNTALTSGTALFQAVDSSGNPISYQVGGGGQQIAYPTICSVANGALQVNCMVANTALTNPANVCFELTIKDGNNNVVLGGTVASGYGCLQPQSGTTSWCSAGTCNLDQFVPNVAGIPTARFGPPTALSLGGIFSETCTVGKLVTGIDTSGNITCGSPLVTAFTTTAAASDSVTVTGMTAAGHCLLQPTNAGAAGGIASVYISAKATNQITVTHTATSGWTFDVLCTPN